MELICDRCKGPFDAPTARGYCSGCCEWFRSNKRYAAEKANPSPDVHLTGQFNHPECCPRSFAAPESEGQVCGLCGCAELEPGYGFAGGYGLGSYVYCTECHTVLDFHPDTDEE